MPMDVGPSTEPQEPTMADFRVLMHNQLGLGPYDSPGYPTEEMPEDMIVVRSGDILYISDAFKMDDEGADHLDNYYALNTQRGLWLFDEGEETFLGNAIGSFVRALLLRSKRSYFLLVRDVPAGVNTEGKFFPVDGMAYVEFRLFRGWALRAAGRHDIPQQLQEENDRRSWQHTAKQESSFVVEPFRLWSASKNLLPTIPR